jgi:hypothetical protein
MLIVGPRAAKIASIEDGDSREFVEREAGVQGAGCKGEGISLRTSRLLLEERSGTEQGLQSPTSLSGSPECRGTIPLENVPLLPLSGDPLPLGESPAPLRGRDSASS